MAAVRNVGEGLVERIVAERKANGPFADIFDFSSAWTPWSSTSARWSLGQGRSIRWARPSSPGPVPGDGGHRGPRPQAARERDLGITSLFAALEEEQSDPGWGGGPKIAIPDTEFDKSQRLAFEKEMLGLYVSDHPLMGYEQALARLTDCSLSDMREEDPQRRACSGAVGGRGCDRPAAELHQKG